MQKIQAQVVTLHLPNIHFEYIQIYIHSFDPHERMTHTTVLVTKLVAIYFIIKITGCVLCNVEIKVLTLLKQC